MITDDCPCLNAFPTPPDGPCFSDIDKDGYACVCFELGQHGQLPA